MESELADTMMWLASLCFKGGLLAKGDLYQNSLSFFPFCTFLWTQSWHTVQSHLQISANDTTVFNQTLIIKFLWLFIEKERIRELFVWNAPLYRNISGCFHRSFFLGLFQDMFHVYVLFILLKMKASFFIYIYIFFFNLWYILCCQRQTGSAASEGAFGGGSHLAICVLSAPHPPSGGVGHLPDRGQLQPHLITH